MKRRGLFVYLSLSLDRDLSSLYHSSIMKMFDVFVSHYKNNNNNNNNRSEETIFGVWLRSFCSGKGGTRKRRRRRRRTAEEDESIKKRSEKRKTEFIEREDANGHVRTGGSGGATTVVDDDGGWCQQFQKFLVVVDFRRKRVSRRYGKQVREEGETRAKMTGGTESRRRPHHRRRHSGHTDDDADITARADVWRRQILRSRQKMMTRKSAFKSRLVASALCWRMALVVVFVPTDLTFNAIRSATPREVSEKLWRTSRSKKTN